MSNRGLLASLTLGTIALSLPYGCGSPAVFSDRGRDTGGTHAGGEAGEGTGAAGDGGTGGEPNGGTAGSSNGGSSGDETGGSGGKATGGRGGTGARGGSGGAGGATGGSGGSAGTGGSPVIDIEISIDDDDDDALWVNGSDERLFHSDANPNVEVGADAEMARAGFRFHLPIPAGSTIDRAVLRLVRVQGDAAEDETMIVQVMDSATVPPFDDAHDHGPEEHDPGGLFAETVEDFLVGADGDTIGSPDLTPLVRHVVERSDFVENGTVVFVLSAGSNMMGWAQFADRHGGGDTAVLELSYRPPP